MDGPRTECGHTGGHTGADANVCLLGIRRGTLARVKYVDWDDEMNSRLKDKRGIGSEDVAFHIEHGDLIDILEHRNPDRYRGLRIFVIKWEDSVCLVPFVEDEHTVFLKTIIPHRTAAKPYQQRESARR